MDDKEKIIPLKTAWYPCPPPDENSEITERKLVLESKEIVAVPADDHPIWQKIKYTSINFWAPNVSKTRKEAARRHRVTGVEVRDLPLNHFLYGEQGLYAIKKFEKFDILGICNYMF